MESPFLRSQMIRQAIDASWRTSKWIGASSPTQTSGSAGLPNSAFTSNWLRRPGWRLEKPPPVSVAIVLGESVTDYQLNDVLGRVLAQLGPKDRVAVIPFDSKTDPLQSAFATQAQKERIAAYSGELDRERTRTLVDQLALADHLLRPTRSKFEVNRVVLISGSDRCDLYSQSKIEKVVSRVQSFQMEGTTFSVFQLGAGEDGLHQQIVRAGGGGFMQWGDSLTFQESNFLGRRGPVARNLTVTLAGAPACSVRSGPKRMAGGEKATFAINCLVWRRAPSWPDFIEVQVAYDEVPSPFNVVRAAFGQPATWQLRHAVRPCTWSGAVRAF